MTLTEIAPEDETQTEPTADETAQAMASPAHDSSPRPTGSFSPAAVSKEVTDEALVYLDPDINIFITIDAAGWTYTKELYPGEVYFYPEGGDPAASPTGIAISSQSPGTNAAQMGDVLHDNLAAALGDVTWEPAGEVSVGAYTGALYRFTADDIAGCYVCWETDARLYIGSLTTPPDTYGEMEAMLLRSLKSFLTLEEITEK
jgi:hypothetical protein